MLDVELRARWGWLRPGRSFGVGRRAQRCLLASPIRARRMPVASSLYPTGGGGGQSSDGGRATAVRLPREPTARTTQRRQVGTILPAKTALKRPPGPEITLRSVTRPSAVKVTRTCSREAKPEPVTVTGLALASFRRGSLGAGAPGAAGRTGGHTTTGTSLIR